MINLQKAEFLRSAAGLDGLPKDGLPQIVFAGRSNVGKSSIINCLLNRKSLARTSSMPGKTANINLYSIDRKLYFSDLPGYGFAQVGQKERERWGRMMNQYFAECHDIALGILVVDLRHKPTDDDVAMAGVFRQVGIPFVVVANKADKLKNSQRAECEALVRETLEVPRIIPFSAVKALGRQDVLNEIFARVKEN
ncbi:MAG: YihA family ribosome biogenesis GTP-binding protein [Ruminococcaceae bacterium]|nr:YihA family ribosome biogenesis GTP-binding protein [Oscillospiraceae bacterium]